MTVQTLSMLYNVLFLVILISVCGLFSFVHLWISNKIKLNYWLLTTGMFTVICFVTIVIWYNTIGFLV